MVHIFAPEQHDRYDGHFVISANRIYMVAGLNDPEGWDHLNNEAKNVKPVSGTKEIDVNEIQNTGVRSTLDGAPVAAESTRWAIVKAAWLATQSDHWVHASWVCAEDTGLGQKQIDPGRSSPLPLVLKTPTLPRVQRCGKLASAACLQTRGYRCSPETLMMPVK